MEWNMLVRCVPVEVFIRFLIFLRLFSVLLLRALFLDKNSFFFAIAFV